MSDDKGKGTGEAGWTPQEKGQDAGGLPGAPGEDASAGEAGDASSKGRPSDEREKSEAAAANTERDSKR